MKINTKTLLIGTELNIKKIDILTTTGLSPALSTFGPTIVESNTTPKCTNNTPKLCKKERDVETIKETMQNKT